MKTADFPVLIGKSTKALQYHFGPPILDIYRAVNILEWRKIEIECMEYLMVVIHRLYTAIFCENWNMALFMLLTGIVLLYIL